MACRGEHLTNYVSFLETVLNTASSMKQLSREDRERQIEALFIDTDHANKMRAEVAACPTCSRRLSDMQP